MEPSAGTIIEGKYRLGRLLGQGGMGAVYEGENMAIARRVAIKILHADVASQQGVVERFEREAQAAGRIGNDHILEVLDIGTLPDGSRFIVMEYLEGETLEQRVERRGRLTPAETYPVARQALVGLAAAHDSSIIHRDLKPDNVFIIDKKAGQTDFVKLIDFGISKFVTADNDLRMTATGAVMGTPYYMAPEQARGSKDADLRADIYSMGVILYRATTGRVPFEAESFNELLFSIVLKSPPKPSEHVPGLDPGFESIILKAMARAPEDRFASAVEFTKALDAWAQSGAAVPVPLSARVDSKEEVSGLLQTVAANTGRRADLTGPGWTNSSLATSKRSRTPTVLAIGTVAAAALLGAAFWLTDRGEPAVPASTLGPDAAEAMTGAATSAPSTPPPEAAATPVATTAATPPPEPTGTPPAEVAPAATARPKSSPTVAPSAVKRVVKRVVKPAPQAPPKPAVTAAPKPPAPPKPAPVRPKKPSEPDFGY